MCTGGVVELEVVGGAELDPQAGNASAATRTAAPTAATLLILRFATRSHGSWCQSVCQAVSTAGGAPLALDDLGDVSEEQSPRRQQGVGAPGAPVLL